MSQGYDIKKERDNESRPFTDIELDAELRPHDYLSMDTDLTWSPYDYHFKTLNAGGTISDARGDSFKAEYRYKTESSESLYSRINVTLTDEIMAFYSFEKNLKDKKTLETNAGLSFEKSCWTIDLFYSEVDAEKKITFLINLHGIGEFGTK